MLPQIDGTVGGNFRNRTNTGNIIFVLYRSVWIRLLDFDRDFKAPDRQFDGRRHRNDFVILLGAPRDVLRLKYLSHLRAPGTDETKAIGVRAVMPRTIVSHTLSVLIFAHTF